jgi:hypothetical protein
LTAEQFVSVLENLPAKSPAVLDSDRGRALIWLALAPAWPASVAVKGFPAGPQVLETGDAVIDSLRALVNEGLVVTGPGEPPLEGDWYWIEDAQRKAVIASVLANPYQGIDFLYNELWNCAAAMRSALGNAGANPSILRWLELALSGRYEMAAVLTARVSEAIAESAKSGSVHSVEAAAWIEAANPLAEIFGGSLEVALAGGQRRLEAFRRGERDARSLKHYYPRKQQEDSFEELIAPGSDSTWAIHYAGMGGIGKTMLVRRIRADLAKGRVAVGHVDFDQLNPDYPRRAPGLLLQSLAADLRLNDDPSVARIFEEFDQAIQVLHQRLQGRYAERSTADDMTAEGIGRALVYFADALERIGRRGLRPLFILDTCEELERMRLDSRIQENLRFTFDLIEKIHEVFPALRVVFSGRRPLACSGAGWLWPGCSLPSRSYLRLFEINPFSESEAIDFLHGYSRDGLNVPSGIVPAILDQSRVKRTPAEATNWLSRVEWTGGAPPAVDSGLLYYPYDLNLFAVWASSKEGLDVENLKSAGAHYYVRERIVDRIGPILRPWLADLVLLGRFDRGLIKDLTGSSEQHIANLWKAIVYQEWTELDRTAQTDEVWSMDPHLRDRLLAYYRDEDRLSLESSRSRVSALLSRITLERDFKDLSPAHFTACVQALVPEPSKAATWWNRVEDRIAAEARWDWAAALCSALLAEIPASCPLWPAFLALQGSVQLHLAPGRPYSGWQEVLNTCGVYPDPVASQRLRFRASAGLLVDRSRLPNEAPAGIATEVSALLETVDSAICNHQMYATIIALIEAAVERLELPPRQSVEASFHVLDRFSVFDKLFNGVFEHSKLPLVLKVFALSLLARINSRFGLMTQAQNLAKEALTDQCWLDWRVPDNLPNRLLLEGIRLGQSPPELTAIRGGDDVDADRLTSAALMSQLAGTLVPAIPDSRYVPVTFTPLCNAHRAFPPSMAARIEYDAALGSPDASVRLASEILGNSLIPEDDRRAVDECFTKVGLRLRLYEEKIGAASTTSDSRAKKILQLLTANFVFSGARFERRSLARELEHEEVPDDAHRRRGENLLLAAILSFDDPKNAVHLYINAQSTFAAANDQLGEQICDIGHALCAGMTKRNESAFRRDAERAAEVWSLPGDTIAEWLNWLDTGPRALRPWRARLVACKARLSGPRDVARYLAWAAKAFANSTPYDILRVLAPAMTNPFSLFSGVRFTSIVRRSFSALLVVGVLCAVVYGANKVFYLVLDRLHSYVPSWFGMLVLIGLTVLMILFPTIGSAFASLAGNAVRVRRGIICLDMPLSETDPLTVPWRIEEGVCLVGTNFALFGKRRRETQPVSFDKPYSVQAAGVRSRILPQLPVQSIIEARSASAAPWEAIFSLNDSQTHAYHKQKHSFRREDALMGPSITTPIPRSGRVVTWRLEADRYSARVWSTALQSRLKYAMEEPILSGTLRRDDTIEVLHILGRPMETPSGICVQMVMYGSSSASLFPSTISSLAPHARVCIVQDFTEEPRERTTTDRYAGNVARLLGQQIHLTGIPVVIMIPTLSEELSRGVLANIANAIGRFRRFSKLPLLKAVEKSRREIAQKAKPDAAAATELACDLVFYSTPTVRLHLAKPSNLDMQSVPPSVSPPA